MDKETRLYKVVLDTTRAIEMLTEHVLTLETLMKEKSERITNIESLLLYPIDENETIKNFVKPAKVGKGSQPEGDENG